MITNEESQFNFKDGLQTKQAVNQVTDIAPTKAELTTSFGTPASRGAGFVGTVNDNAGGANMFFVTSDGTDYFWVLTTKAL